MFHSFVWRADGRSPQIKNLLHMGWIYSYGGRIFENIAFSCLIYQKSNKLYTKIVVEQEIFVLDKFLNYLLGKRKDYSH